MPSDESGHGDMTDERQRGLASRAAMKFYSAAGIVAESLFPAADGTGGYGAEWVLELG